GSFRVCHDYRMSLFTLSRSIFSFRMSFVISAAAELSGADCGEQLVCRFVAGRLRGPARGAGARSGGARVVAGRGARGEAGCARRDRAGLRDGGWLLAGEAGAGEEEAEVDVRRAAIDRVAIHVHVRPLGRLDVE